MQRFCPLSNAGLLQTSKALWQRILKSKGLESSDLTILLELITSIADSTSAVGRTFSLLTLLLSDGRLSTMESLLIIQANDKVWSGDE